MQKAVCGEREGYGMEEYGMKVVSSQLLTAKQFEAEMFLCCGYNFKLLKRP